MYTSISKWLNLDAILYFECFRLRQPSLYYNICVLLPTMCLSGWNNRFWRLTQFLKHLVITYNILINLSFYRNKWCSSPKKICLYLQPLLQCYKMLMFAIGLNSFNLYWFIWYMYIVLNAHFLNKDKCS